MMNKKKQGFSLAELLISLLIISIVLSAAIPTITKKSGASRENIWHWSDQNNSVYTALGDNQSVLMGMDRLPSTNINNILQDINRAGEGADEDGNWNIADILKVRVSTNGDKVSILKKQAYSGESDFANSHISFYNTYIDSSNKPVFQYSGRLTMDPGNIALGIGSLQNQNGNSSTVNGENTAIGHLALTQNEAGIRNTALGRKTLTKNVNGHNNTAIGFGSLYTMGINSADQPQANTAVGSLAQRFLHSGNNNTSIGFASLYRNLTGNDNTALGYYSLPSNNTGHRNTAVGAYACGLVTEGHSNICLGYQAGINGYSVTDAFGATPIKNYGLFIGTPVIDDSGVLSENDAQPALITGHTIKEFDTTNNRQLDKELFVNARKVTFSPYDGSARTFEFISNAGPYVLDATGKTPLPGKDGYDASVGLVKPPRFGIANFNLRDTGGKVLATDIDSSSITLTFEAPYATRMSYISTYDKYSSDSNDIFSDINFNNALTFDFPKTINLFNETKDASADYKVAIRAESPYIPADGSGSSEKPRMVFPLLLNDVVEINNILKDNMGDPQDPAVFLNYPTDKSLHISFRPIKANGVIDTANSNDSNIQIGNSLFSVYLSSKKQPAAPAPSEAELFILNSVQGLNYKTAKGVSIDASSTLNNRILFKNIHISDNVAGSGAPTGDIRIVKGNINLEDGDINVKNLLDTEKSLKKVIDTLKTQIQNLMAPPSDERIKNISGDNTAGLKEINALQVKNYTYKDDKEKTPHVGVIAQQLQKVFPNSVIKDDKGFLRIKTEEIFYAMVNSIKDLCKQIQDLTAKVTGLDKRITELENQNKMLLEQNKAFEKRLANLEKQSAKK